MNRKSIVIAAAVIVHLLLPSVCRGDFAPAKWQFYKEIHLPESLETQHAFFQVDGEIYDGSLGKLQSLRIIDADMREVPYQIVTKQGSERREQFAPRFLNNSYLKEKHNSFLLDLGGEPASINELTIMTTSDNFTRRASVEGGNDQIEWNMLVDDAYIYDFSRNVRARHLRIEFPLSNFRYLRVKIFDDGSGPLEISGAKVFKVRKKASETESWPLTIIERTENEKDRTTEIVLDPGNRGLPIQQLKLDVESRNYHRSVRIESSKDRKKWVSLGTGTIFNYDLPEFKKTDNLVSFREDADSRYFKLKIENHDDRPLKIGGVSGIGLVRRVVMPLERKKGCRIYFGNYEAKAPRYDLAQRIRYIETERLPHLKLSRRQSNPDYRGPAEPRRPWTEERAYLLWIIMAVVIIVLASLIFNLMRRTEPEYPDE